MKLKQKSSKKKITIVVICILAVILGAAGYVFYKTQNPSPSSDASDFQDANPITTPEEEKQQSYEEEKKEHGAEYPKTTDPDTPLTVTFTNIGQQDTTLRVRATADALISGGTCTLTLTKNGTTITKTAPTFVTAHTSTCQGFDVPVGELSPGSWDVTLEMTKDSQSGRATTAVNIS